MENNTCEIEKVKFTPKIDWTKLWDEWKTYTIHHPSRYEMFDWWKNKIKEIEKN